MSQPIQPDSLGANAYRGVRRPLVCELVGLPGAGKTSAAARIVQQMRAGGCSCGDRPSLGRGRRSRALSQIRKAEFHLTHPRHLAAALRFGLSVHPLNIASVSRAYRVSNWAYGLSRARNRGFERVILDQGIVQELWSVTLTGSRWSPRALDAVLRGILAGTDVSLALVYLDIGIDEASDRLRRRPVTTSRFDRMELSEARALLSSREAGLKELFQRAVALTGAPWCRVDGERALEDVCAQVTAFVDGIADGYPAGSPSDFIG
jgi:hypothetical protein